jgi:hypothetical protein
VGPGAPALTLRLDTGSDITVGPSQILMNRSTVASAQR